MLATPVVIKLRVPHEGKAAGSRVLAIGGLARHVKGAEGLRGVQGDFLCMDREGGLIWVPIEYAVVEKPPEVELVHVGGQLSLGGTR